MTFREAIQGDWRILIDDQLPDEAYDLTIEGDRATFTGEAGIVIYRDASASVAFPSGAALDLNDGLKKVKDNAGKWEAHLEPVTNASTSLPIMLGFDGTNEAAGFMFRPWALTGTNETPGTG